MVSQSYFVYGDGVEVIYRTIVFQKERKMVFGKYRTVYMSFSISVITDKCIEV